MAPVELLEYAADALSAEEPTQVQLRRAVSAAYYGLFHSLTQASARVFTAGGPGLAAQATRAYSHTTMRRVCQTYSRSAGKALPPPLDACVAGSPQPALVFIANVFLSCQEERQRADYDLTAQFSRARARQLALSASTARDELLTIIDHQDTVVFLSALLLADRWGQRG